MGDDPAWDLCVESEQDTHYRLGCVLVDPPGRRLLLADGLGRLAADTQQVEVLLCLIRRYPSIVSKDELIVAVWGGRYVTDAALHKTVSMLRKLLREHHGGADLIETRHRRGYQLVRAAEAVPAGVAAAAPSAAAEAAAADGPAPRPRMSQTRRAALLALVLLIALAAAGGWLWWTQASPPAPAPVVDTSPVLAEALARMETEALIQTIKDALVPDPGLARQAAAELRRRGGGEPLLRGLADKFDGIVAYRAGDFPAAEAAYLRALPALREAGERVEEANVLNNIGVLLAETGSAPDRAEALYREALAIRAALGDSRGVLGSHRNLSNLLLEARRLEAARAAVDAYEATAAEAKASEDLVEARILRGDVMLASAEGDPRPVFEAAMALAQEAGLPLAAASASQRLGRLALRAGDPAAARAAFQRALDWYRESGATHQLDVVLYNLATAVAEGGDPAAAIDHFEAVLAVDPLGQASALRVDARLALARLHATSGQSAAARVSLAAAQREALVLQNDGVLAGVAIVQADLALREGEVMAARGHLNEAEERLQRLDDWELSAQWRMQDAWLRIATGQLAGARAALDRLRDDARARGDQATERRLPPLEAALAAAGGNWAAAYRWHLAGQTTTRHAAASLPVASARRDGGPGIVWALGGLALGLAAGLGWRWRRSKLPA